MGFNFSSIALKIFCKHIELLELISKGCRQTYELFSCLFVIKQLSLDENWELRQIVRESLFVNGNAKL